MNFDISKLGAGQSKAGGGKGKPRFGPAVRPRPKPAAKPAEAPATDEHAVEPQASDVATNHMQQGCPINALPDLVPRMETASFSAAISGVPELHPAVLPTQPEKEVHRPAAAKRKAVEAAAPEGVPAHDLAIAESPGNALELTAIDNSPEAASTGPMTKAKKRKGMNSGAAAVPRKPKTPLAELKIDAQTMNMKTVIKCANAKDRAKSNAAQLAKDAAAAGQGSSGCQQAAPPPTPEPVSIAAPQMIVDPETGNLVLDKASLTVQAQPREEYVRREEGHHDLVNSQTYLKRGATNKWTPEETDEFWAGLAIFGDMPGMIATRLNLRLAQLGSFNITRTSKHVKNKIKKERSKNARQVDALIANQHAEPEDYAEVQEGLEPTQVDEVSCSLPACVCVQ
ncbi:Transcription factor TFIIIB component B, variant 2 [Trebouxia sp. C0010 RCD-2024]